MTTLDWAALISTAVEGLPWLIAGVLCGKLLIFLWDRYFG